MGKSCPYPNRECISRKLSWIGRKTMKKYNSYARRLSTKVIIASLSFHFYKKRTWLSRRGSVLYWRNPKLFSYGYNTSRMLKYVGTLFVLQEQVTGLCICIQLVKWSDCLLQQGIISMQNLLVFMSNLCLLCQKSILGCIKSWLLGEVIASGQVFELIWVKISFGPSFNILTHIFYM